jgi:DNA polymerase/3'-5' exonuclease PolX
MNELEVKRRFPLEAATKVANELVELLRPDCERIEIAGSIRRRRPDVGDIELLVLPIDEAPAGYKLHRHLERLMDEGVLSKRLNKKGSTMYGPSNKLLIHNESGIPVDIFASTRRNWGMALVVRTGPVDFNKAMMTRFLSLGMKGHAYGGVTGRNGEAIHCPEEADVFRLLQWDFIDPWERT